MARQLKEILGDRFDPEELEAFASGTLEELERTIGREALRQDQVQRVLAITVPRVLPCRLCCLTFITLGLYYFIRPHDDVAVLLLQRSGHVLMLRKEDRPGWSGELKFLVAIVLINMLPPILCGLFFLNLRTVNEGVAMLSSSFNTDERHVHRLMTSSLAWFGLALFAAWVAFVVCLWCHRQRGYGTQAVRRFKCAYVSAAQFTLEDQRDYLSYCCRRSHQKGCLRLFFGKYPAQDQLDSKFALGNGSVRVLNSIATGSVTASTERSQATADGQKGKRAARSGPILAIMFFLFSAVVQLSVLYEYYEEMVQLVSSQSFCGAVTRAAHGNDALGRLGCDPNRCRSFFSSPFLDFGRFQPKSSFCRHVRWVSNATYLCPISRASSCCSFCVVGSWYEWMGGDEPKEWVKSMEAALTYFVTIAAFFTSAAVISYLTKATFTPQAELDFVHDIYQHQEGIFQMKSELALDFMHHMFAVDGAKDVACMDDHRDEVWLLDKEEAPSWQAFFGSARRLTALRVPLLSRFVGGFPEGKKVCMPETCLGLAPNEKVLKAWDEKSFLIGNDILKAIGVALVMAVTFVYAPKLLSVRLPSQDACHSALGHSALDGYAGYAAAATTTTAMTTTTLNAAGPESSGSVLWRLAPFFQIMAVTVALVPVLLLLRWIELIKVQCAIIVTSHRVFSIAYRPNFLWSCPFGWGMRLEVFRHDSQLFYGRMSTKPPPFLHRLCTRDTWRPGEIVMQSLFGVLQIWRSRGEAREIFDMVATRLSADVSEKDGIDPKCGSVDVANPDLFGVKPGSLTRVVSGTGTSKVTTVTWESSILDDPRPVKAVPVKSVRKDEGEESEATEQGGEIEHLLFIWSFQEEPRLTAPLARFNDIAITTDSIRLSSSTAIKPFDCRSCCLWQYPLYALQRLLLGTRHLPEMQSFLNFSHLQAFSTEYAAEPPLFSFRFPCFDVLCGTLTRCATCYWCRSAEERVAMRPRVSVLQQTGELLDCEVLAESEDAIQVHYNANLEDEWLPRGSARLISDDSLGDCFRLPVLATTRMSLFLLILQKYAQEVQPDLILCLRPCYIGVGGAETGSLEQTVESTLVGNSARLRDNHSLKEVKTLKALLNLVLDSVKPEDAAARGEMAAA